MEDWESRPLVLVVDDDADHAYILEALLETEGYAVLIAASRAEGRAILETRPVDVLLADLALGDGTALDLVRGLGGNRPRVSIVLSGFDSADDIDRSRRAGFDAHLTKPASIEMLRNVIGKALRRMSSGIRLAKGSAELPSKAKRSAT